MSDVEPPFELLFRTSPVVEEWLKQEAGIRSSPAVSLGVPGLVRYLCGALSPQEADALERGLVAAATARRRLRDVRAELLRLEALPWTTVAEAARGDGQAAEIAAAWLALAAEQIKAAEHAPAHWLAVGWQTVRSQVEEGVGEALSAWNAFLTFGAQWSRALHAPSRFAPERGGEAPAETILPGVTVSIRIEADIEPDDTLVVTLQCGPQSNPPATTLDGRTVLLALRDGLELWPLAAAPLVGGTAEWRISGFGAATGMPAGALPVDALHFALADGPALPPADFASRLLAEITDAHGRSTDGSHVPIIFLEEPRWLAGEFLVRVEIPAETRYWLTAGYRLRLDVAVSGNHWQNLGAWTLADGDDAPRILQASCPGSLDVILPSVTLIRAQLRPPE